jgi:hypothetical protein
VDYILNEKLFSTQMDFWRKAATTPKILKIRKEVVIKNGNNTNSSGKNEK